MTKPLVILAGATGNLGRRVATALVARGADVRAIVRPDTKPDAVAKLEGAGVSLAKADPRDVDAMALACAGGACVVSTVNGLREVIVDSQSVLLEGAVKAGVPRFIPSDFSADYTKLADGENRNFDLRREFAARLDKAPIAATSILNGAFADMLTGTAPIIIPKIKRVVYWSDADQKLDFTTMDDTAAFTAAAALDPSTPRTLRVAGDQVSARDLAKIAGEVKGHPFGLLRAGGLRRLETLIAITRTLFPQRDAVFSAWQGMQYMHNMFSGRAKLTPLDNDRYPGVGWTTAREVLAKG